MYLLGQIYSGTRRRAYIPIYNETGPASCRRMEVWLEMESPAAQRQAMKLKLETHEAVAREGMKGYRDDTCD